MLLSKITDDDIPTLCNYVIDELHRLGTSNTKHYTDKLSAVLLQCEERWKVETDSGTIVAFGVVEEVKKNTLHVVNYYITKEYRQTKAAYLITKKMVELMEPYPIITRKPLPNQPENKFCTGNKINKTCLKRFIQRFDKRWEVDLEQ